MAHNFNFKGLFRKITGDSTNDGLNKPPIPDADIRLNLYKDLTSVSTNALEVYLKSMSKSIQANLKDKFVECQELFVKAETKSTDLLLNKVFDKITEAQKSIAIEVNDLTRNLDKSVLKPLTEYQKDVSIVKDNKKEFKESYEKVEICKLNLDKARREYESMKKNNNDSIRYSVTDVKRQNEAAKLQSAEEKLLRYEKELDEAKFSSNERYDRYTEGLYKKVSEECDLANYFLEYLQIQRQYHQQVYQMLDTVIPQVKSCINNHPKKPIFGCPLQEYFRLLENNSDETVSPVIRKLVENMFKQEAQYDEGIFRIAGSKMKMNRLMSSINAGYLDVIDFNDYDVHCLASVLKQYLRELPDSIMCNDLYEEWQIASTSNQKMEAYKKVISKLPKINYENIRYLVKFLARIVENADKTKMNSSNIGICFGASLLNITNAEGNKNIDMSTATSAFDFMLSNHAELFPEDIPEFQNLSFINGKIENSKSNSSLQNITQYDLVNRPSVVHREKKPIEEKDAQNNSFHKNEIYRTSTIKSADHPTTRNTTISSTSKNVSVVSTTSEEKLLSPGETSILASPRLRAKKQAPAPPPTHNRTPSDTSLVSSNNLEPTNVSLNESPQSVSSLFPKLQNTNNQSESFNQETMIRDLKKKFDCTSTIVPVEKPSNPPPTVPLRPPPIGFQTLIANMPTSTPQPTVSSSSSSNEHLSDSPSSLISDINSPSPSNTLNKPPKPALPPKPIGNGNIADENHVSEINSLNKKTENPKSAEITSL